MHYDAIIIGGSFAGLSAATMLARARRHVLIIDSGTPRNRFSTHSHGVLGQDGKPGGEILTAARDQISAYETVSFMTGEAAGVSGTLDDFRVETTGQQIFRARHVLLSMGFEDTLPAIPGFQERWGSTVLHCPYCHGYEIGGGEIGVIATSPMSTHQAALVADWGKVQLLTNGMPEPDDDTLALLERRNVELVPGKVVSVGAAADDRIIVALEGGRSVNVKALFVAPESRIRSSIPDALGCAFTEFPTSRIITTDGMKQTTVPGIYAAGDIARPPANITLVSADGVTAGLGIHQSLIFAQH